MPRRPALPSAALVAALLSACGGGEPVPLAVKAEKLEVVAPKAPEVVHLVIDPSTTQLGFDMEAPIEKIRGRVPASATTGELWIDPADLGKSRGLVHVDLTALELFQRTASEDGQPFGEETKNPTQNEHARVWLEISPDTPPEELQKNVRVEFALTGVGEPSARDLTKMTGPERQVTFVATGDFLLHQRKAAKSVKLAATFRYDGDALREVHVKSVEPLQIGLDEYDVRPRSAFSKLAAKTLEQMAPKVAKSAEVHLEFTAKPAPGDAKPNP